MLRRTFVTASVLILFAAIAAGPALVKEKAETPAGGDKADQKKAKWAPAVDPKPLSENVKRGLGWLSEHQLPSGAWGQGEESAQMGGGAKLKDAPSVADTCIATLALIRSGSTPAKGQYAKQISKAVAYVCSEIEKADKDSLHVTSTRGTRVQSKLGPYIDTFMASMLLSEVQEQMPGQEGLKLVSNSLDKVLHKMHKNQRADGTWDDRGWAATLAQGMAVKGLNRAAQQGKAVPQAVLERAASNARKQFDSKTGKFSAKGSAGVELYSAGANVSGLADSVNTNAPAEAQARKDIKTAKTQKDRERAQRQLAKFEADKQDLADARKAVVARLEDKQFIAGFGSNGGEEFLSHMSIGESLVAAGGEDWKKWDESMTKNMNRVQNKDGSWSGHHCITGRTFCTSAALLVLMVDRSPVPIAAKIKKRR